MDPEAPVELGVYIVHFSKSHDWSFKEPNNIFNIF